MSSQFILPKNRERTPYADRVRAFLISLPTDKDWLVEFKEYRRTRSDQQNRYLWAVCYPTIIKAGGETLAGWSDEDLHEYFLGEHFGWETIEGFGRKRQKPVRRSSKLSVLEFAGYVDYIHQRATELGIFIPDPETLQ